MKLIDADKIEWIPVKAAFADKETGEKVSPEKKAEATFKAWIDEMPTVDAELTAHTKWISVKDKLSKKYDHVEHENGRYEVIRSGVRVIKESYHYPNTIRYTNKSYRVFASNDLHDGRLLKCKSDKKDKFADTSLHSFIFNENVEGVKVPAKLDKQWYIDMAKKRLNDFGVR